MKSGVLITFIICGTAIVFIPLIAAMNHIAIGDDYAIACCLLGAIILIMSLLVALAPAPTPVSSTTMIGNDA